MSAPPAQNERRGPFACAPNLNYVSPLAIQASHNSAAETLLRLGCPVPEPKAVQPTVPKKPCANPLSTVPTPAGIKADRAPPALPHETYPRPKYPLYDVPSPAEIQAENAKAHEHLHLRMHHARELLSTSPGIRSAHRRKRMANSRIQEIGMRR
jgi:hypothetical protein